jgi:hypothetical protein
MLLAAAVLISGACVGVGVDMIMPSSGVDWCWIASVSDAK